MFTYWENERVEQIDIMNISVTGGILWAMCTAAILWSWPSTELSTGLGISTGSFESALFCVFYSAKPVPGGPGCSFIADTPRCGWLLFGWTVHVRIFNVSPGKDQRVKSGNMPGENSSVVAIWRYKFWTYIWRIQFCKASYRRRQ